MPINEAGRRQPFAAGEPRGHLRDAFASATRSSSRPGRRLRALFAGLRCSIAILMLSAQPADSAATDTQPLDALRKHVADGIAVLQDYDPQNDEQTFAQREALCALAHEMFDIHAFSRLVLASHWQRFSADQRNEFVTIFGEFLCRYYLSRLQARYSNERINFIGQQFKGDDRASVMASVTWRDIDLPIEVRMRRYDGHWKAYDLVVSGISGVLIYRAQFAPVLQNAGPADLIGELRRRLAEQG